MSGNSSNYPYQYSQQENAYEEGFQDLFLGDEEYEVLNLSMPDDKLKQLLIDSLNSNKDHWDKAPWRLEETDKKNTAFFLGDQLENNIFLKTDSNGSYVDNRLFSSTRAIISYATGQLARPEIVPSRGDDIYLKGARDLQSALYQHALDEQVDQKTRAAVMNLVIRKRGYLKLRWDPNKGENGDIVTEVCNPEDIIIDRNAKFLDNPNIIYHRIRCSTEELIARFPDKEKEILQAFSIKQERFTQMSRLVYYYEAWFTYQDDKHAPQEGVCWFLPEAKIILGKQQNPNWIYLKNAKKEKKDNVLDVPPKPFVWFNYINLGHSFIDETCLFEQAKPSQDMLNKRLSQLHQNIDFMNGRWVASKKAFSEEDAQKFVNKGARTIALVDADDVGKALQVQTPNQMPAEVFQSVLDIRNEIDNMMGTPSQFKGSAPTSQDTATRDLMIKNQAGMLQDDLVRCVSSGMERYYRILTQMMRVYYTDDYWFQCKGGDGKYEFILLNGGKLDSNVKISVETDSTLPIDKESIRATAMQLWTAGEAIDYKTFMEDLGLPNPDVRAERYLKSKIDPLNYLKSIEMQQVNDEAESDIELLIANKVPEERDNYDADYFNYFNKYMASNRFAKLQGTDPQAAQRVTAYLIATQHAMMDSLNLQELMLDTAGMVNTPQPMQPQTPGSPLQPGQPQLGGAPQQPQLPTPPQAGGLASVLH